MEKTRLLVIDDNKSLVDMVKEYFKSVPNIDVVQTTKNGSEGISYIKDNQNNFDVILLDLAGKTYSSEQLASQMERIMTYESSTITFVIGGSLGLSQKVIQRANMRFKISDCTFPHQLCRLIICEQIYRAFTIMNHLPYHK